MVKKKGNGKGKKLTLKQAKFTKEYLKSGNATDAARKVYKVNDKTASVMGAENLAKPCIQQTIASAAEKLGINPEYVLKGIKEIHEFNKTKQDKFDANGNKETKMIDAQASLKASELLGKHLSIFTTNEAPTQTQNNFYLTATERTNEALKKLVDVSPVSNRNTIESLI